jgi:hypothetical protein
MQALVQRWEMKRTLAAAEYQRWLKDEAPLWVPLTKQLSVKVSKIGTFPGGPTMYKNWAKSNRTKMIAKGEQETALDAGQVEVMDQTIQFKLN